MTHGTTATQARAAAALAPLCVNTRRIRYVPPWPGLSPVELLGRRRAGDLPFPFSPPGGVYFHRARNAIFHLCRALGFGPGDVVLAPDYHSGNEIGAIRAAGATVRYFPVKRDMQADLDELESRIKQHRPKALFVIHYLGWAQPMEAITALCRKYELLLIEDCALSLFSESGGRPLGSFGDYSIFCLYKTLPLPNGGMLVRNNPALPSLESLDLRPGNAATVASRTTELLLEWLRGRSNLVGGAVRRLKTLIGRGLTSAGVERVPVGDMGFDLSHVDADIHPVSRRLIRETDRDRIVATRRDNFGRMAQRLHGVAEAVVPDLDDGTCPLFYPILVRDKPAAAEALQNRGISCVQFWNEGDPESCDEESPDTRFLRKHVLELPIHQGVTPAQVDYIAAQVHRLKSVL